MQLLLIRWNREEISFFLWWYICPQLIIIDSIRLASIQQTIEDTLLAIWVQLSPLMSTITKTFWRTMKELTFLEDGSKDSTLKVLSELLMLEASNLILILMFLQTKLSQDTLTTKTRTMYKLSTNKNVGHFSNILRVMIPNFKKLSILKLSVSQKEKWLEDLKWDLQLYWFLKHHKKLNWTFTKEKESCLATKLFAEILKQKKKLNDLNI